MRSRCWVFTINNPVGIESLETWDESRMEREGVRYIVGQMERGENGTEHVQGFVQFEKAMVMNTAKKHISNRAHMEVMKGTPAQAAAYCKKEDSRIGGPWELGSMVSQGQRTDIEGAKRIIEEGGMEALYDQAPELLVKYPRGMSKLQEIATRRKAMRKRLELEVIVLWGPSGSGKTRTVYDTEGLENVYSLNTNEGKLWFDGYESQRVLLIDEFYGGIKYGHLLNLLDIYPLRLEVKGGSVWANWTRVYITSNSHPEMWYKGVPDINAMMRRIKEIRRIEKSSPAEPTENEEIEISESARSAGVILGPALYET